MISPNIDRLASEGVELDNFHSYPTCSPTRSALLTGRPPTRFGIRGPLQYRGNRGLPRDTPTIASHFQSAGCDTAIRGKRHLGMRREIGPNNNGFRYSYGYVGPWIDTYTHLTTDWEGTQDGVHQWHRNGEPVEEQGHVTGLLTNEAIRKGQLYEGGIRVPALIHWPGHLKPRKLEAPMLVCDLRPTLAAATGTGMTAREAVEGRNLWGVIAGEARPEDRRMYWADSRNQALPQGNWKLIHFGPNLEEGRFELYDLAGLAAISRSGNGARGRQRIRQVVPGVIARLHALHDLRHRPIHHLEERFGVDPDPEGQHQ